MNILWSSVLPMDIHDPRVGRSIYTLPHHQRTLVATHQILSPFCSESQSSYRNISLEPLSSIRDSCPSARQAGNAEHVDGREKEPETQVILQCTTTPTDLKIHGALPQQAHGASIQRIFSRYPFIIVSTLHYHAFVAPSFSPRSTILPSQLYSEFSNEPPQCNAMQ